MQKRDDTFTVFWWPKGNRQHWRVGGDPVALQFDGALVDFSREGYEPLRLTPQPYSDFAALGKHAQDAGQRSAPSGEDSAETLAIYASFNGAIQREARAFVVNWGPVLPRPLPGGIIYTRQSPPRPIFADLEDADGKVRIILWRLLIQAIEFSEAVRLVKQVRDAEEFDDDPDLERRSRFAWRRCSGNGWRAFG